MIKIHQHLDRADADDYLDSLALKMWEFLNKKRVNDEYRANSLIRKLDSLLIESNTQVFFENLSDSDDMKLQRQKDILNYFKNDNYDKLKSCVICKPNELLVLRNEMLALINIDDLYVINGDAISQTAFGEKLISSIFNYKNYRKSAFCRELLFEAGFENITCPYCNENPINIIDVSDEEDEEQLLRAYLDLDHFYSKSKNPFFALSFFNLIPSCHSCNAIEKRDKDFCVNTHINPYYESFNDHYQFFVNPYPLGLGESPIIEIKQLGDKNDLSKRDLRLEVRYNLIHQVNVVNLINMYQKYRANRDYYHLELGLDWEEALLQNTPKQENKILTKRAGKMYLDIARQIDETGVLLLI